MKSNASKVSVIDDLEGLTMAVRVLYGTTTGNSEILAEETAEKLNEMGLATELSSTEDFNTNELYQIEKLLLIMSTDGDGEPPIMADDLYTFLDKKVEADLNHISYSVLALGDSYYPDFCQAGKDFNQMLKELGAHRITERVDCDIHYWEDFEYWLGNVCSVIEKRDLSQGCNL